MDLFAAINPLLVVSGFVVGMLVRLTGVGGGSLMTPILVLLFGVHATTAVGTDLLYAAITKTGGTLTHGVKGTVDWRVTGRLAAGSIPATILTLFALRILGIKGNASPPLITTALGIALVMTAVCVLSHRWLRLSDCSPQSHPSRTPLIGRRRPGASHCPSPLAHNNRRPTPRRSFRSSSCPLMPCCPSLPPNPVPPVHHPSDACCGQIPIEPAATAPAH